MVLLYTYTIMNVAFMAANEGILAALVFPLV